MDEEERVMEERERRSSMSEMDLKVSTHHHEHLSKIPAPKSGVLRSISQWKSLCHGLPGGGDDGEEGGPAG